MRLINKFIIIKKKKGIRYALIETDIDFKPEDFKAIAVYSDKKQTSEFSCSDAEVNQLFENKKHKVGYTFIGLRNESLYSRGEQR